MTPAELLALFRAEVDDQQEPFLWPDAAVFGYLDDAQKEFCRKTEGIEDARTPSVCCVQIVPGQTWYPKSRLIRKVRSAARMDNGRAVPVVTPENAAQQGLTGGHHSGPLRALVDGQSKGFFRAWPVPSETVTLELAVFRLPLQDIADDGAGALEIDPEHHPRLLAWMKYRAYTRHDPETYDPQRAQQYQADFWAYCAAARMEQGRIRRQTGTVAYGGI